MNNSSAAIPPDTGIQNTDVPEKSIRSVDKKLLDILLSDRTTHKNILWATRDYESLGVGFEENAQILPPLVTGPWANLIQPRITKSISAQADRTRDKAEVFTPSWICNKQNNLVDEEWFRRKDVFNRETGSTWETIREPISFDGARKGWKKYVDARRLEISCGEAPYLVSRYDAVTGQKIPLGERVGLLDRKMRIVRENTETDEEWLFWSQRAYESVYGYEYQGDSLLLARENLLYSYIEYYNERFGRPPSVGQLKKIARIISWNIWQMDGLKYIVPGSCTPEPEAPQLSLFAADESPEEDTHRMCRGCARGDIYAHTGIYCRIKDWRSKCSRTFISMMKGGK